MNVRITPRENLQRQDLYGGVVRVEARGALLILWRENQDADTYPLSAVALIELDDQGGMWW